MNQPMPISGDQTLFITQRFATIIGIGDHNSALDVHVCRDDLIYDMVVGSDAFDKFSIVLDYSVPNSLSVRVGPNKLVVPFESDARLH